MKHVLVIIGSRFLLSSKVNLLLVGLLGNGLGLLEGTLLLLEALLVLGGAGFDDLAATLGLIGILFGLIELNFLCQEK